MNNPLTTVIRNLIEQKFGRAIRYSSDVDDLCDDIQQTTHKRLSVNTLKRLLGLIDDVTEPRLYTLDIVASYLGCENWDALLKQESGAHSEFGSIDEFQDLAEGDKFTFTYPPDREVTCQYLGSGNQYVVIESKNGKLKTGDTICVDHIIKGYPLLIENVLRSDRSLGPLVLGRFTGITTLNRLSTENDT